MHPIRTGSGFRRRVQSALITAGVLVLIFVLYAQLVRRTTMFYPSKFPEGTWNTSQLPVQPEDVEFKSSDGVRLHGWFFHTGEPTVIFFHGNAGNITERGPICAGLAKRGVSVFVFDWRGYGKSDGSPSESGLFRDALAAYDYVRARTNGDIVPYGESLGGPYAAYVAAHRKVRCVIIENSFPSLAAIGNVLYRPLPLGLTAPFSLMTTRWLNQAGVPVLVMHGKRDQVIPFQLGMDLYNGLKVPKEFLTCETAGHCEIANVEPERVYETITRFVRAPAPR
ncbi:MAG: alpha/beta hydrolase [Acidobacteria bacterium]|nr:MAG: alpha/beta hydrolase [Acidobacteriota bacterium]